MTTDTAFDTTTTATAVTAEQAADRLVQILNDGSLAVLVSVGHDSGLFEAMAGLPPASSHQIADAAGLQERQVREWLGGMVTGGIVEWEPRARTYQLGPSYVPVVTGPTADNLARSMRYVTMMGHVAPQVARTYRTGGGLAYADYPGFHEVMAQESAATNDHALLPTILPLTGMVDRLAAGIDVLDIGCGSGHAINVMARAYPASRFTGIDFSADAVDVGRAEAADWGLTNATFTTGDVARAGTPAAYDLVTAFDCIHDQADPATVLANVRRALRPDGAFLMVDINAHSALEDNLDLPWAGYLYAISSLHCLSVSLGQGGAGLGTVWGVELAEQMVREAGFGQVERHDLDEDPFNAYFVARP